MYTPKHKTGPRRSPKPAPGPAHVPKTTSWDSASSWYDSMLESGEGTYQGDLIAPNILRLLELHKGERVLDVGCGQGFFARAFHQAGASVFGVDLSAKLIAVAKERSPKDIAFSVSKADKLVMFQNDSFDAVVCISAIQNMENVPGVFTEVSRVLKRGGRFVIVMNHPSFRILRRSSWGVDEKNNVQYRRVDEYMSESQASVMVHPSDPSSGTTVSFHHPLQFYFKAFRKAGLCVTRLEEWVSQKKSQPGPKAVLENKARKEFPLFLTIEARKL